jgi:hypothetical protein
VNEEALAHWGLSRQKHTYIHVVLSTSEGTFLNNTAAGLQETLEIRETVGTGDYE